MANQEVDITEDVNGILEEFSIDNISVDDYCKSVMSLTRLCQKYSNELQGWHHYSDYKGVRLTMNKINSHLNYLIARIFSHQDIRIDLFGNNLTNQFEILREANDALLERVSIDLDEASGIRRNIEIEMLDSTIRTIRGPVSESSGRDIVLLASRNVQKPQLFFATKINNSSKEPFTPPIKDKPNSKKPLSIHLCQNKDGQEYYSHPYEYELQHWMPQDVNLIKTSPVKPLYLPNTPFQLVENESQLQQMIEELQKSNELAVDLEAHQFRSYQGLTCLIQISTREKDYIVDPFPIREKLFILNEVFTNPSITKVFHGADADILWLQRDFGVYVVNLFDTHQAAVVLNYPHRSLAALLHKFCSINANKSYQRADWRIRPLPEDFIQYARQDSHYLLYIYDELRNELVEKGNELNNLINAVYCRSTEICLKRYEKPIVGSDSHLNLYRRSRKFFNSRQLYALQHLFLWRDKVARDQDESVEYVLPKHMMLQVAEILPKEMQGILACCNPIPTLIKTEQLTLLQIVREAREQPLTDVLINVDILNVPQNAEGHFGVDDMVASSFISRHDLSMVEEKTSGLSTLMNPQETLLGDLFTENQLEAKKKKKSALLGNIKAYRNQNMLMSGLTDEFMSPFERYKKYLEMKPLMEENLEKEKPEKLDADTERVNKIHEHFLSLSRSTYKYSDVEIPTQLQHPEVSEGESDLDRMRRLQSHIAGLVKDGINFDDQETDDSSYSEDENEKSISQETKFDDKTGLDKQMQDHFNILRSIRASVSNTGVNNEKNSEDLDRMSKLQSHVADSARNDMDVGKKISEANGSDDEEDEINQPRRINSKICMSEQIKAEYEAKKKSKMNTMKVNYKKANKAKALKRKSSEPCESSKMAKMEEMPIADTIPTESNKEPNDPKSEKDVAIIPFDYETADFNMFKNKKAAKLNAYKMKLKERFKAKAASKVTGKKKSGLKSISWGTKK